MSEYINVSINVGSIFIGIGMILCLTAIAWLFYQFSRKIKQENDLEEDYNLAERCALSKTLLKLGIEQPHAQYLEQYKSKICVLRKPSFRTKLQKKVLEEYFKKDKGE